MDAGPASDSSHVSGTRAGTLLIALVAGVCGVVLLLFGVGLAGVLVAIADQGSSSPVAADSSPEPTSSTGAPAALPAAPVGSGSATPSSAPVVSPTAATAVPSAASSPPTSPAPASPKPTTARAAYAVVGVTDGDTLKVRVGTTTERVRLIGLDAPELKSGECWAQKAASKMQSLVQSKSVHLARDPSQADRDRYGRLLRHVSTTDGRLVAELLIAGGFARELTYDGAYEGRSAYQAAEKGAKAKRLGIWSAACAAPPVVTAPTRAPTAAVPVKPASGCVIKGNINSEGEKIYHVPGGGSYDQTVITASKGERWFCSEQAALNTGWRKARN